MMLPTHALVGLAIAVPLMYIDPALASPAIAGALVGSIVPDLDMYAGHRRTLHYPTGYFLLAIPVVCVAVVIPTVWTVGGAFLLIGAALHCQMDRLGGGLELRPWEATSDRAVYDHVKGRWRQPKRWIRYDGAPEDFGLAVVIGLPLLFVLETPFFEVVLVSLAVAAIYSLLRRPLSNVAPVVFGYAPDRLGPHVPRRYRESE